MLLPLQRKKNLPNKFLLPRKDRNKVKMKQTTVTGNTHTFLLPTNKGGQLVCTQNILRIQASSNYCKLFFTDGTSLVVAKVLKWFEDKLAALTYEKRAGDEDFIRIHHAHIINAVYLQQYSKSNSMVQLNNNEWITVSRRKKSTLLAYCN